MLEKKLFYFSSEGLRQTWGVDVIADLLTVFYGEFSSALIRCLVHNSLMVEGSEWA